MSDAAVHLHALMHEVSNPASLAAVIKPYLAVWVPTAVQNPAAQILRQAGHGVGVVAGALFLQIPYFAFERLAQGFIGIDGQDPIVTRLLGGEVFLGGVAGPGALDQ